VLSFKTRYWINPIDKLLVSWNGLGRSREIVDGQSAYDRDTKREDGTDRHVANTARAGCAAMGLRLRMQEARVQAPQNSHFTLIGSLDRA
jgi:hypothetical protein